MTGNNMKQAINSTNPSGSKSEKPKRNWLPFLLVSSVSIAGLGLMTWLMLDREPKPITSECHKPEYICYKPGEDQKRIKYELKCAKPLFESPMKPPQVTIVPDLPPGFAPCKEGEMIVCVDVTPKPPAPTRPPAKKPKCGDGKCDSQKENSKTCLKDCPTKCGDGFITEKEQCEKTPKSGETKKCEEGQVCNRQCKCVTPKPPQTSGCLGEDIIRPDESTGKVYTDKLKKVLGKAQGVQNKILIADVIACKNKSITVSLSAKNLDDSTTAILDGAVKGQIIQDITDAFRRLPTPGDNSRFHVEWTRRQ